MVSLQVVRAKPTHPCSICHSTDWWWRPDNQWGLGEWLCNRYHPNSNKEAQVTTEKQPQLLTEVPTEKKAEKPDKPAYYKGLMAGSNPSRLRRNPDNSKTCLVCGATFRVRGQRRQDLAKYCSVACKAQAQKGIPFARVGIRTGTQLQCATCGKEFYAYPSRKSPKYCSSKCQGLDLPSFQRYQAKTITIGMAAI